MTRSEIRARAANPCKKRGYPSAVAAYEALILHARTAATPTRAYRCPICPADPPVWHLTRSPRRPPRPGGAGQHLGGEAA